MTLDELKPGQSGRITTIGVVGPLKRRLMDMGVLVGVEVKVIKIAPMGDPLEVALKSYRLSLRRSEAQGINVEALS
ncbi:MAG: iron transporter FeoA [Deltaproteobacteria bacterium HGW-Deltaproteobacteria-4]|nr:MAG: iron transporter FeoA [Deltaproteobacteria bacterium HGW-Deltaproteobacteria-4]